MSVEEYLTTVTEQIRCRQARESVREEMENHLEDQIEECIREGMDRKEAENFAVRQMGDPVEAGISLDRVHRPKTAWGMIAFIEMLSLLGIIIQYFISIQCKNTESFSMISQLMYMLAGFGILITMYYLDYSFFGTYGKYMAIIYLCCLFLQVFCFGLEVNGARGFISAFGGRMISLRMLLLCYIPMYAGVLYSYRNDKQKGIVKSIIFLIIPVWIGLHIPCLVLGMVLFFSLFLMLSAAIVKGWFQGVGKKFLFVAWSIVLIGPSVVMLTGLFGGFSEYQLVRLQSFISKGDPKGNGYTYYQIRNIIENSKILGRGDAAIDTSTVLPQVGSDFIITHVMSYYGILSGILVFVLLAFLVFKIFHISVHQKNQLGMMIGVGCGSLFGCMILIYFLENIGLLPYSYLYLPLLSQGGSGMFVTYFLLGIILSIYKYQDIPLKVAEKKLQRKEIG